MEAKSRKVGEEFCMEKLVETLQRYFRQNPPNYGDAESVLDMLYWHYMEHGCPDSEKIQNQFSALRKMVNFPSKEYDQVFYVVSDLCLEYGALAFSEGLRMSMELVQKLDEED